MVAVRQEEWVGGAIVRQNALFGVMGDEESREAMREAANGGLLGIER